MSTIGQSPCKFSLIYKVMTRMFVNEIVGIIRTSRLSFVFNQSRVRPQAIYFNIEHKNYCSKTMKNVTGFYSEINP